MLGLVVSVLDAWSAATLRVTGAEVVCAVAEDMLLGDDVVVGVGIDLLLALGTAGEEGAVLREVGSASVDIGTPAARAVQSWYEFRY